jgi:superfamily II DNA or RNA helicase
MALKRTLQLLESSDALVRESSASLLAGSVSSVLDRDLSFVLRPLNRMCRSSEWTSRDSAALCLANIAKRMAPSESRHTVSAQLHIVCRVQHSLHFSDLNVAQLVGAPPLLAKKQKTSKKEQKNEQTSAKARFMAKRRAQKRQKSKSKSKSTKRQRQVGGGGDDDVAKRQRLNDEQPLTLPDVCDSLVVDLMDDVWTVRHGAARCLRALIACGYCAASTSPGWLELAGVRAIAVLAADQFADFADDRSQAPVRDANARLLASVANAMPELVDVVAARLLELADQASWFARSAALTALRLVAPKMRGSIRVAVVGRVADQALELLGSAASSVVDDEVLSVAADVLVPLANELLPALGDAKLRQLCAALWSSAALAVDGDDLSNSIASRLQLIVAAADAGVLVAPKAEQLRAVLALVYSHALADVRLASLRLVEMFGADAACLLAACARIASDESERVCEQAERAVHRLCARGARLSAAEADALPVSLLGADRRLGPLSVALARSIGSGDEKLIDALLRSAWPARVDDAYLLALIFCELATAGALNDAQRRAIVATGVEPALAGAVSCIALAAAAGNDADRQRVIDDIVDGSSPLPVVEREADALARSLDGNDHTRTFAVVEALCARVDKARATRIGVALRAFVRRFGAAALAPLRRLVAELATASQFFALAELWPAYAAADVPLGALRAGLARLLRRGGSTDDALIEAAAWCTSSGALTSTGGVMEVLVDEAVPLIGNVEVPLSARRAALHIVGATLERLPPLRVAPYVSMTMPAMLAALSDADEQHRRAAANQFAALVALSPLDGPTAPPPDDMSAVLAERRQRERAFVGQLVDGGGGDARVELPPFVDVTLRPYQRDGVNWLDFLRRYNLNGCLADQMGLGKTVQSICVLAIEHAERCAAGKRARSLIVAPASVQLHWLAEIERFCGGQAHLRPTLLDDVDVRRLGALPNDTVLIASYGKLRRNVDALTRLTFAYAVLDEGHLIKNHKTATAAAARRIVASHRLVLTGTPVSNCAVELWSMFDFLMPGFLGSHADFRQRYVKPIRTLRFKQHSEEAARALDSLHKTLLPFILRRLKSQVLGDLPPKMVQDWPCDLTDAQCRLYEQAVREHDSNVTEEEDGQNSPSSSSYQRKCSFAAFHEFHKIFVTPASSSSSSSSSSIGQVEQSCKLAALRDILRSCGIGQCDDGDDDDNDDELSTTTLLSRHRVLVFAQYLNTLDLIERLLFLPLGIGYLRLDSNVPTGARQLLVSRFNSDPTIDCMLCTTGVGGLGLTMTGADTVVFVEHDWNVQRDLQAMDRAHRIGQRRTVNVYRIIVRNSIEERIMSLQQFKLAVAASLVSADNASSSATDNTLDVFEQMAGNMADDSNDTQDKGKELLCDPNEYRND